MKEIQEEKQ